MIGKRGIVTTFTKYLLNPFAKPVAGYIPGWALLETVGRASGRPHLNPVGYSVEGSTLWIVAEHGTHADYVKNMKANPHVRVRVGGRWRNGKARVLANDDPGPHLRRQNFINSMGIRLGGTDPLPIRIDLE